MRLQGSPTTAWISSTSCLNIFSGATTASPFFANGVETQPATNRATVGGVGTTYRATWDSRSGAMLNTTVNSPWTDPGGDVNTTTTGSSFAYDAAGRMTTDITGTSGAEYANSSYTLARTYDDENHTIASSD